MYIVALFSSVNWWVLNISNFFDKFWGISAFPVNIDSGEIRLSVGSLVAAAPSVFLSGGFGALRNWSKLICFFMQKEVMTMNDYEMIMVVSGIIGPVIACLSSGVSLGSKRK